MCAGGRRYYYEANQRAGGSDVYIEKNWSQMSSLTYDASPFKVDASYLGRWQTWRIDFGLRLYTALILSAKNYASQPCWRSFVLI